MQQRAGARGITCQKLGEAEVMADGGLDDILITYNILGDEKLARLGALAATRTLPVAADNPVTIAGLPKAAAIAGRPLERLGRVRQRPQARRRRNARRSHRTRQDDRSLRGLEFAGFVFYPLESRHAAAQAFLDDAVSGAGRPGSSRASCRRAARRTSPPLAVQWHHRAPRGHLYLQRPHDDGSRHGELDDCALHVLPPWSAGRRPNAASWTAAPRH